LSFDAILFDFDGVLVDSEPLHYQCWCDILIRYGFRLGWDDYEKNCIGVSDKAMIRALCRIAGRDELFDSIWSDYPLKKAMFRDRIANDVPMPEETRELLLSLRGYRLAVVSSSGRQEIEPALESAGVRGAFETVVTGEDVAELKPSPEPYLTAAARLAARRPLVVEDSHAGIAAGMAAGFEVVRIPAPAETAGLVKAMLSRRRTEEV
jgi:beta-phosphoglucomutase